MNLSDKQPVIAVYHSTPLVSRTLAKWQTQREQRQLIKRIKVIDSELRAIDREKGDLLQRIVSSKLEIIEILALRNTYEKELSINRVTDAPDPFKALTKQFIDQQIDKCPGASQREITDQKHSIERILTEVFALDNAGRNQLVLGFSNYSRLYNEKQSLLARTD